MWSNPKKPKEKKDGNYLQEVRRKGCCICEQFGEVNRAQQRRTTRYMIGFLVQSELTELRYRFAKVITKVFGTKAK